MLFALSYVISQRLLFDFAAIIHEGMRDSEKERRINQDRASESSSDLRERLYMLVGGWCTRIIPKLWSFFEFLNSSLTRT